MNIKQLIEQGKVQYDLTNTWIKHNLDDLEKLNFELFIQILFDNWKVI